MMISRTALVLTLAGPLLTGCGAFDACADAQAARLVSGGRSDVERLEYDSSDGWDVPLTPFPAQTLLIFEHGLGVTPLTVLTYVSFDKNGTSGRGNEVTENAGNQGHIECVDSQVIHIMNNTCEENLHVRVTASGQTSPAEKPCSEELE
jgi:hypothetical protein